MEALSEVCREEILMVLDDATEEYVIQWLNLHQKIYRCLMDKNKEQGIDAILEHYRWSDKWTSGD